VARGQPPLKYTRVVKLEGRRQAVARGQPPLKYTRFAASP
jgi:hypothetical protein